MTQKHLATWPESPKRVRKKILTHAKDTPRSHTKLLSSPSRDLASLGIILCVYLPYVLPYRILYMSSISKMYIQYFSVNAHA